jgi:20S proteasome alpha/beta subunit
VTVGVATLFRWNYSTDPAKFNLQSAAIIAADRMITAGDIQYEPFQSKLAAINHKTIVLVAGDYAIHSHAVKKTMETVDAAASPYQIAQFYGHQIQLLRRQEAEAVYLAPLGLNTDTFLAQQRELSEAFVTTITEQMQRHRAPEVEALVIGSSEGLTGIPYVQLYHIDTNGIVSCCDDVGFAAIGSGAWHAKSNLMQNGYTNGANYATALTAIYAAKKAADIAPGVGKDTDLYLVFKDGFVIVPNEAAATLAEIYETDVKQKQAQRSNAVALLQAFLNKPEAPQLDLRDEHKKSAEIIPGTDAQTNAEPAKPSAETALRNEARPTGQILN